MNLEELRDARRTERERDGLQSLPDTFYRDVAAYLSELKAERDRAAEAADDPFSDAEVRRLTEEIETAEEVAESIYERRVGKVVDRASFAAADMRHDTEGLTAEERDLFDDLVARIERNRERVLDAVDPDADGEGDADANANAEADRTGPAADGDADARAPAGDAAASGSTPDPDDLLAEAMGGASGGTAGADDAAGADGVGGDAPATAAPEGPGTTDGGVPAGAEPGAAGDAGADPPDDAAAATPAAGAGGAASGQSADGDAGTAGDGRNPDRRTVYVTRDVGEIFGVDERTYRLAAEDVVDLPADNARALVERDAAEPLE